MAKRTGAAHVVTIKKTVNGREYRTDLLRRSYRDGKHVRNETLGNLTHLGPEKVEQLRRTLRGEKLVNIDDAFAQAQFGLSVGGATGARSGLQARDVSIAG